MTQPGVAIARKTPTFSVMYVSDETVMEPYPANRYTVLRTLLPWVGLLFPAGFSMADTPSRDGTHPSERTDAPRTTAFLREHGNHLRDEPSLYLRQHAHNPIDWYPWSDAALQRARSEDKPIFLSVGYASCHWCHVMEHEVFEDDRVAEFMNRHFICIKVDREERPDLDAVYMDAVQMLTGRGGWPMSVWLTPDQRPFFGGTYFPRHQFVQLNEQIVQAYDQQRDKLDQQAAAISGRIAGRICDGSAVGPPTDDGSGNADSLSTSLLAEAIDQAKHLYDEVNAGFRQQQKFPTPIKWRFLVREYRRTGDDELGEMIRATCRAMAGGGLYDHVGGGFHRYTVDPHWTVPHFEKMLYDNAQLAGLFLEAGVAFDEPDWTAVGGDVLEFLLRDMRGDEGGFYASYDADSGGQEGTYYIWSPQEIIAAVGQEDGAVLADLLGVDDTGNFEHSGKSVLTRRGETAALAVRHGRTEGDLCNLFQRHRPLLQAARAERTPPGLDRKIVTSWNGLVIAALAQGYAVTADRRYLEAAERAADFLLTRHRDPDGRLLRSSSDGRTAGNGILDDYAFLADGLLELYQVSGQVRWLTAARNLVDTARDLFTRPDGGYYLTPRDGEAPLGRTTEYHDSVIPSGNAVLLIAQIKLTALTGEAAYADSARTDLQAWSSNLERYGIEMTGWLEAVARTVTPLYDVVIAGAEQAADTHALQRALLSRLPFNAVISLVPAAGAGDDRLAVAPALRGKTALDGRATAYVCEYGACRAPTHTAEEALAEIDGD